MSTLIDTLIFLVPTILWEFILHLKTKDIKYVYPQKYRENT